MDEYTADVFVNRDEPIPVLTVTDEDGSPTASASEYEVDKEGRRQRLRKKLSASRLKDKARQLGEEKAEGSPSLQDRLFNRLLAQVIPAEDADSDAETIVDRRSSKYVKRPAFSLALMTNNFRRFNARIGIVFVFQNRLIRLFTWKTTSHTLSFLSIYTFVCLDPYLLVAVPLAALLLFIMVPAFLARHPPPPPSASTSSTTPYSYYGPALAPPRTIKPASETSKDFFRNMRDLQNSMADFAAVHDSLVKLIAPPTNFSNEVLSSSLFLFLSVLTALLFISAHLLPWRFIFLTLGYTLTITGHPTVQAQILILREKQQQKPKSPSSHSTSSSTPQPSLTIGPLTLPTSPSSFPSFLSTVASITLSTTPETREVEIFELQHRPLIPAGTSSSTASAIEWTPHVFTPTPYDPLSPARISGSRPPGCRFFEDVQPPKGWVWKSKKWELDLQAAEWVGERLVTGVEFEVSPHYNAENDEVAVAGAAGGAGGLQGSEEFGGWVWDLPPPRTVESSAMSSSLSLSLPPTPVSPSTPDKVRRKPPPLPQSPRPQQQQVPLRDWEESTMARGSVAGRTGEWRRRRWVRIVQRVGSEGSWDADGEERLGKGMETGRGRGRT